MVNVARPKSTKPPSLSQIAARIDAHLRRFEADSAINTVREGGTTKHYYNAGAWRAGRWVHVCYVSYQGHVALTKQEAINYLAALDGGQVGKHRQIAGLGMAGR